jgi:hypothetical protein
VSELAQEQRVLSTVAHGKDFAMWFFHGKRSHYLATNSQAKQFNAGARLRRLLLCTSTSSAMVDSPQQPRPENSAGSPAQRRRSSTRPQGAGVGGIEGGQRPPMGAEHGKGRSASAERRRQPNTSTGPNTGPSTGPSPARAAAAVAVAAETRDTLTELVVPQDMSPPLRRRSSTKARTPSRRGSGSTPFHETPEGGSAGVGESSPSALRLAADPDFVHACYVSALHDGCEHLGEEEADRDEFGLRADRPSPLRMGGGTSGFSNPGSKKASPTSGRRTPLRRFQVCARVASQRLPSF